MRMAFCLDGDFERQVGVEARCVRRTHPELRAEAAGATRVWHRDHAAQRASCRAWLRPATVPHVGCRHDVGPAA
jgi:hypothetical protein